MEMKYAPSTLNMLDASLRWRVLRQEYEREEMTIYKANTVQRYLTELDIGSRQDVYQVEVCGLPIAEATLYVAADKMDVKNGVLIFFAFKGEVHGEQWNPTVTFAPGQWRCVIKMQSYATDEDFKHKGP